MKLERGDPRCPRATEKMQWSRERGNSQVQSRDPPLREPSRGQRKSTKYRKYTRVSNCYTLLGQPSPRSPGCRNGPHGSCRIHVGIVTSVGKMSLRLVRCQLVTSAKVTLSLRRSGVTSAWRRSTAVTATMVDADAEEVADGEEQSESGSDDNKSRWCEALHRLVNEVLGDCSKRVPSWMWYCDNDHEFMEAEERRRGLLRGMLAPLLRQPYYSDFKLFCDFKACKTSRGDGIICLALVRSSASGTLSHSSLRSLKRTSIIPWRSVRRSPLARIRLQRMR